MNKLKLLESSLRYVPDRDSVKIIYKVERESCDNKIASNDVLVFELPSYRAIYHNNFDWIKNINIHKNIQFDEKFLYDAINKAASFKLDINQ